MRTARTHKYSKDSMTTIERKSLHKFQMLDRRQRQLEQVPDNDARLVYFSRNSLPEYRK